MANPANGGPGYCRAPGLSTTQQYQQTHPAVHGGIIGALVVLVLVLLIGGGAFLFISNRNSAGCQCDGQLHWLQHR